MGRVVNSSFNQYPKWYGKYINKPKHLENACRKAKSSANEYWDEIAETFSPKVEKGIRGIRIG